jgi:hypothetical protein
MEIGRGMGLRVGSQKSVPIAIGIRSQKPEAKRQKTEDRIQKSEVRGQKLEV